MWLMNEAVFFIPIVISCVVIAGLEKKKRGGKQ